MTLAELRDTLDGMLKRGIDGNLPVCAGEFEGNASEIDYVAIGRGEYDRDPSPKLLGTCRRQGLFIALEGYNEHHVDCDEPTVWEEVARYDRNGLQD